ncbi:MAG: DUF1116 domain-containing protein [Alphaproteobacteria bacterium]|nr:DUF1116 domain-containing protein [Alphaproteobacteria bacterium]
MTSLFGADLTVINVGLSQFVEPIAAADAQVLDVAWTPPAGDEKVARALARLVNRTEVEAANATAFARYLAAQPTLVGVAPAADAIAGLPERTILHSGPPIEWQDMCAPVQGAIVGACLYEGWAESHDAARKLLDAGEVSFSPCHHYAAVGPMAGIISPSMPVWIIEDSTHGITTYSNLNEGLGKVLRFGANSPEVIEHLRWMQRVLGPALTATVETLGPLELKPLMAQALHMGDEVHNRNAAASALLLKRLIPAALDAGLDSADLSAVVKFINSNDHFFLNLSMPACKAMMDAAHGIAGSSMVTAMARNGVDFGIRVSGLGERWFTVPAPIVHGLFFPGYSADDANPDLGDSTITETAGIGAFAMAASPAIVQFVGGSASDAIANTRRMSHITIGRNDSFTLPQLDFGATPAGIDIRKVIDTGIEPVINTGIAHREAGIGQIGAGITHAPMACFSQAVSALAETFGD